MLLIPCLSMAQKTVVADAITHLPIAHASLYARSDGKFHSAVSDSKGRANVNFSFAKLTVSHLNYETLRARNLSDTIFLKPKEYMTAEVKVTNREPKWIRKKLRAFVKVKDSKYLTQPDIRRYSYSSRSIGRRRFYQYDATGLMAMKSPENKRYCIRPLAGIVVSDDTTRLTDTQNMRRMLYEDFVEGIDRSFIRGHHFAQDKEYKGKKDEVKLAFWTDDKTGRDKGHLIMDTLRLTISSVTRHQGLDYNKRTKVSSVMLSMNWLLSGYKILVWDVDSHTDYADIGGSWQPVVANYKFFYNCTERIQEKKDSAYYHDTGNGFTNIEATLKLEPADSVLATFDTLLSGLKEAEKGDTLSHWISLPKSWYMRLSTDLQRREEVRISHLPCVWKKPED